MYIVQPSEADETAGDIADRNQKRADYRCGYHPSRGALDPRVVAHHAAAEPTAYEDDDWIQRQQDQWRRHWDADACGPSVSDHRDGSGVRVRRAEGVAHK